MGNQWMRLALGAVGGAALFAALTYGLSLAGATTRSRAPITTEAIPFLAAFGALWGVLAVRRADRRRAEGTPDTPQSHRRGLQPLIDARNGLPSEAQAARTVATGAVIPAAIAGIAAGTQLVGEKDSSDRLLAVCTATAFGAGFGVLLATWGVYRVFGFRPVVRLADTLIGGFAGFFAGSALGYLTDSWWPWLLCPAGAVLVPLLAPRPRPAESAHERV